MEVRRLIYSKRNIDEINTRNFFKKNNKNESLAHHILRF